MYTYYALRAMGRRPPKFLAMFITTSQLAQMVVGCLVNTWAYQIMQNGEECHVSITNIKLSLTMYFSYFVLFARFFHKAYLSSSILESKKEHNNMNILKANSSSSNGSSRKFNKYENGSSKLNGGGEYGLLTGKIHHGRTKVE
jgi:hypothetical protein